MGEESAVSDRRTEANTLGVGNRANDSGGEKKPKSQNQDAAAVLKVFEREMRNKMWRKVLF